MMPSLTDSAEKSRIETQGDGSNLPAAFHGPQAFHRVALLTDYYLPHAGGSRGYYHTIYKRLSTEFPVKVTVVTKKVAGWREFDRQESTEAFRIIRRFKPLPDWKVWQWPKIVWPLAETLRLLLRGQVEMIHCGDLFPPGVIALGLKRFLGIPFLIYCHGEEVTMTDRFRRQAAVRNRIYQAADAVIAANEVARKLLVERGVQESKIHKILPGVDCDRFHPAPRNERLVRKFSLENRRTLLTVSRLVPRKGHDVTLRAVAKIAAEIPNVKYLVVGCGPEEARLKGLAAELDVSDRVSFAGYVPDHELAEFYNLCDVFVLPNREESNGDFEGFGAVFLEANAAGKAVIGGRSGGAEEAVQDGITGFLVDPLNVDQLASRLKLLLLNPALCAKMELAGIERAQADFSWRRGAERLAQITAALSKRCA